MEKSNLFKAINKGLAIAKIVSEMTDEGITLEQEEWDLRGFKPEKELLDIGGCGEYTIMNHTDCEMTIIDHDPDRYIENERVKTLHMDARDMEFGDERFQTISIFYTLLYMNKEEINKVLLESRRVLKKSGHIHIWDIINDESPEGRLIVAPVKVIGRKSSKESCFASNAAEEMRDIEFYRELIKQSGLTIVQEEIRNHGVYIDCVCDVGSAGAHG